MTMDLIFIVILLAKIFFTSLNYIMQVNLNSAIVYNRQTPQQKHSLKNSTTKPLTIEKRMSISFAGATVVQKTITSQIEHEKSKLLRLFKDILALNVPILTEEEKIFAQIKKAHALIKASIRKEDEIEFRMLSLMENNSLNAQQKLNLAQQLKKEYNRLLKTRLTDIEEQKPPKDNFDYSLISKFKNAILNNDFNLAEIQEDHYSGLKDITTVKEFKEKYPSIRIPANPREVIAQKIFDTFDRDFYYDLDRIFDTKNESIVLEFMFRYCDAYFEILSEQFEDMNKYDLLNEFGKTVTEKVLAKYLELKENDNFESIPENVKYNIAEVSKTDKEMLKLDYDALVIGTLKQLYLENKKLNQIEYKEGDTSFSVATIKDPTYQFEKIPEKMKRLIAESYKPAKLQKEYQKYTTEELKARLNYFVNREVGNRDEIFDTIIDFDSSKFTNEDKQYLIKFLHILDDINEGKISIDDGITIINSNSLRPHGTFKLNEIERKTIEEKIKQEKEQILAFNKLRENFDDAINKLYALNLASLATSFSKFYPENNNEESIKATQKAIEVINKNLRFKNSQHIQAGLLRWEIFNDYLNNSQDSIQFKQAMKYAQYFGSDNIDNKCGQYLINRELVDNYPKSLSMAPRPKILERVMQKFDYDKDLATIYLCKHEDYLMLDKKDKQSILKILEIFDEKNSNDRVLLKPIIEKDYINNDTAIQNPNLSGTNEATMASKAKLEIFNKYKFPGCVDLYKEFEEALSMIATEYGTSGIKKTGTNNNAIEHKIEVKIMGYPDRLFSSQNNYYFDIYDEKGLH